MGVLALQLLPNTHLADLCCLRGDFYLLVDGSVIHHW